MLMTQTAHPLPFSNQQRQHQHQQYQHDGAHSASDADRAGGVAFPSAVSHNFAGSPVGGGAAYRSSSSPVHHAPHSHSHSRTTGGAQNAAPHQQHQQQLLLQQQSVMYVRALYDYEADDRTSLSFHEGDVIQVITQLESGWWDGVINGVRGWFPSNYCQVLSNPEDVLEDRHHDDGDDDDLDGDELYDDQYGPLDDGGEADRDHNAQQLPIEGFASSGGGGENNHNSKARADFWIPQATPDGRLFYYNTMTGESSMELPLESPSSATENGPRDRMNIAMPEKTRPPQEMMAQGAFMEEEEYESEGNSASEMDGESIMMASTGSLVCPDVLLLFTSYIIFRMLTFCDFSPESGGLMARKAYHLRCRWSRLTARYRAHNSGAISSIPRICLGIRRRACYLWLELRQPRSLVRQADRYRQRMCRDRSSMTAQQLR